MNVKWNPDSDVVFSSSGADQIICIWDISKIGEIQDDIDKEEGPSELRVCINI